MNFLLWTGLFCLSFTWLFTLELYTLEQDSWWIILLLMGLLTTTVSLRGKIPFISTDRKYGVLLLFLIPPCFILPFPYSLGIMLTASGLIFLLFCSRLSFLTSFASGVILSGVILTIQTPLGYCYTLLTSYSHYLFWFDTLLHKIFTYFNLKVSLSQHTLYFQTIKDLYPFPTTWEKMAFFPLLTIWAGSIPLFFLFPKQDTERFRGITFILTGIGYLILRYIFMILLFLYLMTFVKYKEEVCWINIFWDARVTLLTFLPLIYLFYRLTPLHLKEVSPVLTWERTLFAPAERKAVVYLSLAFIFLGCLFGFQDPGRGKAGRVLLDEKYSGWEKSTRKMDTEWYGNESGYNFYWMAEFINHHFSLTRNFEEITPELLANYDILILKNTTSPYPPSTITAIRDFVKKGGGLYLMSEHTNVFGNSTYLNPLAEQFGFSFRYDVLFDIETKFEQLYYPPRFLPHPVVQHVPYFCFKVSCSIQPVSLRCEPIMVSNRAKALDIYYPSGNFYPQVKDQTDMPFGAFMQMVGVKYGKGRVIGFTDSTTYSNFEAFIAGKPELLLGTLGWLNRENRWGWFRFIPLALTTIFFLLAVKTASIKRTTVTFHLTWIVLAFFWFSCTCFIFRLLNQKLYPLPLPHTPFTRVVFEQELGDYELPLKGFTKVQEKSYEVFYQWVLRVGYYPFTGTTLNDDLSNANILVIINPVKTFTQEAIARVKGYLAQGGKVLLMDNPFNGRSTANELLAPFGITIMWDKEVMLPPSYSTPWMSRLAQDRAWAITGGTSLLTSKEGVPILAMATTGKGTIAVLTFSQIFTNPPMGGSYRVEPNEQQRQIYELEFNLLRGLAEGGLENYFK